MREMLEMHETFETKNIKRFERFKPQAFQASSFKADSDFRQNDDYRTVTRIILPCYIYMSPPLIYAWRFNVILKKSNEVS